MMERLTTRRRFLTQAVGGGLALGLPMVNRGWADEKISFRLDWIPFGRHAPYYVAVAKGYYSSAGLDVTVEQGTGTLQGLRALAAGQAQFNFNDIGSMIVVRGRENVPLRALACIYQKPPHTVFFIKGRGIVKPKDLEGKKVAYSPGDSPKAIFPAFAKANGVDESKISWLSVDPNSKNSVLLNHTADAMMTYNLTLPVLEKAARPGDEIGMFVYGDWGVDFYANGILSTEDYVAKKGDVARRFVHATLKGIEFTLANPQEAVAIMKRSQPQLNEELALKEIPILKDLIVTDFTRKNGLGRMTREKMQQTRDLMMQYMDLKTTVPVESLFTNEFLG
jgi:NitT/TauT family transport system substrate-binding protein